MPKTTAEHIHTLSTRVTSPKGVQYEPHVFGARRDDGTWGGWLEFHPVDDPSPNLTTLQETSQPDRNALEYWAGGLEPVYLEGALTRAHE